MTAVSHVVWIAFDLQVGNSSGDFCDCKMIFDYIDNIGHISAIHTDTYYVVITKPVSCHHSLRAGSSVHCFLENSADGWEEAGTPNNAINSRGTLSKQNLRLARWDT